MSSMDSLDLGSLIHKVVKDVFDTMLSLEVQSVAARKPTNGNGRSIVGSVGLAGKALGSLNLHVGMDFACLMTAAMLGMETDEIEDDEEVHDVIGELCNMICGELKSRLCDAGFPCELSIPSITSGKDFQVDPRGWDRSEQYGFQSNGHTAHVAVYLKSVK